MKPKEKQRSDITTMLGVYSSNPFSSSSRQQAATAGSRQQQQPRRSDRSPNSNILMAEENQVDVKEGVAGFAPFDSTRK